ncbi:MAG TPA: hypothetical protein PK719_02465 [Bacteroidales bacterium]|jgi:hypothetical protein|nr:hypothetical protein [Bacteroidales bacterium]OQB64503.1 MAG: hypothetical protein BWX96_00643 [Bacteroidetes bacterium ADurb.Bin145]NMD02184.1 hypothetical protein [Bacteroidales bacterium]HOU01039.1 hypothetical protein [Bacteroidales bacterium]HQG62497.1 hypothetical protein [Bacteroidales bacterium]
MIKRTTAVIFLILANFLFLVQAVVPHHHHGNHICFENKHCVNDNSEDVQGVNGKPHTHDENNNSDDCALKAAVDLLSYQWRIDFKLYNQISGNSNIDGFLYCILNSKPELQNPFLTSFVFEQSTDCSYTSYISESSGLRAPPLF